MTIFELVVNQLRQSAEVQIVAKDGDSNLVELVDGYLGLTNNIRVEGVIRIKTTQPLVSVTASLEGKIFTSNGDARKHSPYEAFGFLTLGPTEFYADDNTNNPQQHMWNTTLSRWDIPFVFPISWGGVHKIHESISASNPEWGFGARISYQIVVDVQIGTRVSKAPIHRNFEMIPYVKIVNSAYERLFLSTTRITCPVEIIRYTPAALKSILLSDNNCKIWSSETDIFSENEELGVGHNFEYNARLSSTIFGPGDKVKFEFQIRPKPLARVRISSVRVWLEEIQGVGITASTTSDGQRSQYNQQKNNQDAKKIDLTNLMSGTTLDRKYLAQELLVWKGTEDTEGEFWEAIQQLSFDVPSLAARIPTAKSIFDKKPLGINPSGQFANRIHIEHKFHIRIYAVTSRGESLPPFNLPAAVIQVTPYNVSEALAVVSKFPKLMEEVVRECKNPGIIRKLLSAAPLHLPKKMEPLEKQVSQISLNDTIVASDNDDKEDEKKDEDGDDNTGSETDCEESFVDAQES
ncbi:hypothetical protein BDR26DRAFT_1009432 [Obelidium mucronatum]|nr:hypothetical protein BDR26DRAFT_1009432 [Obelidium mucronatum]